MYRLIILFLFPLFIQAQSITLEIKYQGSPAVDLARQKYRLPVTTKREIAPTNINNGLFTVSIDSSYLDIPMYGIQLGTANYNLEAYDRSTDTHYYYLRWGSECEYDSAGHAVCGGYLHYVELFYRRGQYYIRYKDVSGVILVTGTSDLADIFPKEWGSGDIIR